MNRFFRAWRHLTTTAAAGRRAFPPAGLQAIAAVIADGERRHRAEVRLVVEAALEAADVLRGMTPRVRARELFRHYGIWDTEENCGVLVYVNLADRQVEIVAGRVIPATAWQDLCATMTAGFARGDFQGSALAALEELNRLLETHYPDDGSPRNQLSDEPVLL